MRRRKPGTRATQSCCERRCRRRIARALPRASPFVALLACHSDAFSFVLSAVVLVFFAPFERSNVSLNDCEFASLVELFVEVKSTAANAQQCTISSNELNFAMARDNFALLYVKMSVMDE